MPCGVDSAACIPRCTYCLCIVDARVHPNSELDLYPHWRIRDAANGQIPTSGRGYGTTEVGRARVKLEDHEGVTKASLEMDPDVHVDPAVVAA